MSGPEHRHDDDRTGNGIVNHGPENPPSTEPSGESSTEPGGAPSGDPSGDPDRGTDTPSSAAPAAGEAAAEAATEAAAPDGPQQPSAAAGNGRHPSLGMGPAPGVDPVAGMGPAAGSDPDADVAEAAALRRMLHGAVGDLQPSEGALVHLHRAVPARRARRRQAVVGVAAAALLLGTAIPAFVHVASSDGSSTANPAIAGHGEQAQGGNGDKPGADAGDEQSAGPSDEQNEGSEGLPDNSTAPAGEGGSDTQGSGKGGNADLPRSEIAAMPACDPGQLGVASAQSGAAGADGTVYGSFKIENVSGKDCSVSSSGSVGFQATGAADPHKIEVVQHTAGDAASGLPDPSLEPGTVLLKPAMAYEVKFAWVPTDTCPTTGTSPSPTPTDAVGGGSTGSGTGAEGAAAQFGSADDVPAEGAVAVTHTPEAGAPTAETTISHACAGTIYRTGVLDAS